MDTSTALLLAAAQQALCAAKTQEMLLGAMASAVQRLFRFGGFEFGLASTDGRRIEVAKWFSTETTFGQRLVRREGAPLFAPALDDWLRHRQTLWLRYPQCAVPVPHEHVAQCVRLGISNALLCASMHWPAKRFFYCVLINVRRDAQCQELQLIEMLAPHFEHAWRRVLQARERAGFRAPLGLTSKQRRVLYWIGTGKTNWEIGRIEGLTEDGVKYHVKQIFEKINVSNRTQAAARLSEVLPSDDANRARRPLTLN